MQLLDGWLCIRTSLLMIYVILDAYIVWEFMMKLLFLGFGRLFGRLVKSSGAGCPFASHR